MEQDMDTGFGGVGGGRGYLVTMQGSGLKRCESGFRVHI